MVQRSYEIVINLYFHLNNANQHTAQPRYSSALLVYVPAQHSKQYPDTCATRIRGQIVYPSMKVWPFDCIHHRRSKIRKKGVLIRATLFNEDFSYFDADSFQ